MHVLLIHQAFVSPNEAGGTRHYEFARHMQGQGHQMTIVASDLSYQTGKPVVKRRGLVVEELVDGIRVLRSRTLPTLHRSFVWRVAAFSSFMLSSLWAGLRAGRADLVMGTSPPIFQSVSAWFVAKVRRRPFLLEIRDLWPEFAIDIGVLKNPLLIILSRWLEGFLYAQATHIIVNSPAYPDYLITKGVAWGKISLIPNGVDTSMFLPQERGNSVRREFGLQQKFVVTYAGTLGMANDIYTILRAADRLRDRDDIRFLLVGDGKERPALQAVARELRLTNLIFVGAQPKSAIPAFLAASDACMATLKDIPMFRTTYPNKVFDYMAAGRPTILAIDGVIRKVLEAAGGGIYVPPGNDAAFADAVRSLSNDREMTKAMGKAARDYVVVHFDRQNQSGAFVNLALRWVRK